MTLCRKPGLVEQGRSHTMLTLAALYPVDLNVKNLGEDAVYTRVSESELE